MKGNYKFKISAEKAENLLSRLVELASDDDSYVKAIEIVGELAKRKSKDDKITRDFCKAEGDVKNFIREASAAVRKEFN